MTPGVYNIDPETYCYNMPIKVKRLNKNAKLPVQGSDAAAGYDVFACLDSPFIKINPHETVKVSTGIAVSPPANTWIGVFARSGMATKLGLRPSNCTGVVDPDYRGPVIVAIHNDTDYAQTINNGDKIAQLIVMPRLTMEIEEVDELDETDRGSGGFGSTGNK